jgi:hypothetical protein
MPTQLTIEDFYRVLKNAVRFYPATSPVKKWLQPQSFRVLARDPRSNAEIGTDTLGASPLDKVLPFFWSREWELKKSPPGALTFSYPLLTAFEIINNPTNGIFKGRASRTYTLEIAVLDTYNSDAACNRANIETGESRPVNQIFLDTERILDGVMRYIGGTVTATTNSDPVEKVYNEQVLEANIPGQYAVKLRLGDVWAAMNPAPQYARVEYPARNIFGTKTRFLFKVESCPEIVFNEQIPAITPIGFEAGCNDC